MLREFALIALRERCENGVPVRADTPNELMSEFAAVWSTLDHGTCDYRQFCEIFQAVAEASLRDENQCAVLALTTLSFITYVGPNRARTILQAIYRESRTAKAGSYNQLVFYLGALEAMSLAGSPVTILEWGVDEAYKQLGNEVSRESVFLSLWIQALSNRAVTLSEEPMPADRSGVLAL